MFDVCTTGDTAHIGTIFKLLPHTRQHGCTDILHCCNCLYHARMVLSVGGSFAYFAWNARCTVTTDLLVWYANTQNDFSPGTAIFSLQTIASPAAEMWTTIKKTTFWKKKLGCSFYLYRFRKYLSYGFPIINFCNPGVHYETPCITRTKFVHQRVRNSMKHGHFEKLNGISSNQLRSVNAIWLLHVPYNTQPLSQKETKATACLLVYTQEHWKRICRLHTGICRWGIPLISDKPNNVRNSTWLHSKFKNTSTFCMNDTNYTRNKTPINIRTKNVRKYSYIQ
jgi:hypothetical protein